MAFSDITTPDETVEAEAMRYQYKCRLHNLVQRPVEVFVPSRRFLNLTLYLIFYLSVLIPSLPREATSHTSYIVTVPGKHCRRRGDKHPLTSCFVILEVRPQPHLPCLLCQYGVNEWSYFQHPES